MAHEYTVEDYIRFIEAGRNDKVSPAGLKLIATAYRKLEQETYPKDFCEFLIGWVTASDFFTPIEELFDYWLKNVKK